MYFGLKNKIDTLSGLFAEISDSVEVIKKVRAERPDAIEGNLRPVVRARKCIVDGLGKMGKEFISPIAGELMSDPNMPGRFVPFLKSIKNGIGNTAFSGRLAKFDKLFVLSNAVDRNWMQGDYRVRRLCAFLHDGAAVTEFLYKKDQKEPEHVKMPILYNTQGTEKTGFDPSETTESRLFDIVKPLSDLKRIDMIRKAYSALNYDYSIMTNEIKPFSTGNKFSLTDAARIWESFSMEASLMTARVMSDLSVETLEQLTPSVNCSISRATATLQFKLQSDDSSMSIHCNIYGKNIRVKSPNYSFDIKAVSFGKSKYIKKSEINTFVDAHSKKHGMLKTLEIEGSDILHKAHAYF